MPDHEPFEWGREHSPYTPEGRIEAAGGFGRGVSRRWPRAPRLMLVGALVLGTLAVIGFIRSL